MSTKYYLPVYSSFFPVIEKVRIIKDPLSPAGERTPGGLRYLGRKNVAALGEAGTGPERTLIFLLEHHDAAALLADRSLLLGCLGCCLMGA